MKSHHSMLVSGATSVYRTRTSLGLTFLWHVVRKQRGCVSWQMLCENSVEAVVGSQLKSGTGVALKVWKSDVLTQSVAGCDQVTKYLGYSSLTDFFPTMEIKANPGCVNVLCCTMQQAYQQQQASPEAQQQRQAAAQAAASLQEEAAAHTDNEWGIEVVPEASSSETIQQPAHGNSAQQQTKPGSTAYDHSLPEGLQYSLPVGAACTSLCNVQVSAFDAQVVPGAPCGTCGLCETPIFNFSQCRACHFAGVQQG